MKKILSPTVLRKDITRFSPLWVLYTVFMFLFLLLLWESESSPARFVNNAPYIMGAMGIVNFFYGGMAAILLFSDLFNTRMVNMLHALPLRREGWFLTHLCAGLLLCLVPNTLAGLITAAMLGEYAYGAFFWLAVMVLEYLFFFSVGVFSVMCAGNGLGALSIYGIVNFLSVLAGWLVVVFYEPVLYGIELDMGQLSRFSPVVGLSEFTFIETRFDNMTQTTTLVKVLGGQWLYLGIAAVVGVGLLIASLFIYRKRQLETAGDFISFQYVSPVFLGIYTLVVGAMIYVVGDEFSSTLGKLFLIIGLAIGFFTGMMLLEKQIRVFRKRNILIFGISFLVFLGTIGLTALDPIGITRYVPETDDVALVTISPYNTVYSIRTQGCTVTERSDVETVMGLHKLALEQRNRESRDTLPLNIRYKLKNGTTVERSYHISESDETTRLLNGFYSRPECVLGTREPQALLRSTVQVEFYPYDEALPFLYMSNEDTDYNAQEKYGDENPVVQIRVTESFRDNEVAKGLIEAIVADCNAGNMSQWLTEGAGNLFITLEYGGYREQLDITVSTYSTNTLAYLKSLSEK